MSPPQQQEQEQSVVRLWGGGAKNPGTKVRGEESVSLGGTYRFADYSILYPISAGGDFYSLFIDFITLILDSG